jgi:hypothetical protein
MTSTDKTTSADQGVSVNADTTLHGHADDQRIDEWELEAAKRALANLRELLYRLPMLHLIGGQIEESDAKIKQYVAASNGQFSQTQVILSVKGLKADDLFSTLRAALVVNGGTDEQVRQASIDLLFPMHPEHYVVPIGGGVVETMGGLPTQTHPTPVQEAPDFVTQCVDTSYPIRLMGAGPLQDGTPFTYVLQQFKDTNDGMEANLRIWYPAACPPIYLEDHAKHYAVEFRNGCRMVAATRNQQH